MEFEVAPLAEITKRFETRAIGRGIQFGGDNNHRFFDERCAKGFQFAVDDLKRTDRIVGVELNDADRELVGTLFEGQKRYAIQVRLPGAG